MRYRSYNLFELCDEVEIRTHDGFFVCYAPSVAEAESLIDTWMDAP